MQEWFNSVIEWLLDFTEFQGALILLITVPLTIIQGIFTLFPFVSLVLVHVATFGLAGGLLISGVAGSIASIVCFVLCRFFFYDWFHNRFMSKMKKYDKWQRRMNDYAVWVIILLRSFPFMPNNLISFMASLSPIRGTSYIWATTIGNLSHVWLLGLISSALFEQDITQWWLVNYIIFCLILLGLFFLQVKKRRKEKQIGL